MITASDDLQAVTSEMTMVGRLMLRTSRRCLSSLAALREAKAVDLAVLPEVRQRAAFLEALERGDAPATGHRPLLSVATKSEVLAALQAGMATFCLHAEARVAAACGEGFYTIGPCGEELLAAVGVVLRPDDAVALHYRHLATQLSRHGFSTPSLDPSVDQEHMERLLLDRARGYTVSTLDPVTGGGHCALGGGSHDFIVTSTLASQATPAVGRAIGPRLASLLGVESTMPTSALSYVSLGDGSVNNAHFLSALNAAAYVTHRGFKCPVLFAISDNGLCISLRNYGWLDKFIASLPVDVMECDGTDLAEVFAATKSAAEKVRTSGKPSIMVLKGLPRRFGHAATDRQSAYLTDEEIQSLEFSNPLLSACATAVEEGITTFPALAQTFRSIMAATTSAFDAASQEPKVRSREELIDRNSAPLPWATSSGSTGVRRSPLAVSRGSAEEGPSGGTVGSSGRKMVMRKHMNRSVPCLVCLA